jgi:hypothetical protein
MLATTPPRVTGIVVGCVALTAAETVAVESTVPLAFKP